MLHFLRVYFIVVLNFITIYFYYHHVWLYMICVFECGHMQHSTCVWKSQHNF